MQLGQIVICVRINIVVKLGKLVVSVTVEGKVESVRVGNSTAVC